MRAAAASMACAVLAVSLAVAGERTPDPELQAGEKLIRDRQWGDAEKWFYDFMRDHPRHAEARCRLAYVELHRPGGDAVRARQYLEQALDIERNEPVAMMLLARTYDVNGDHDKARRTYDALIALGEEKRDRIHSNAAHLARFNRGLAAVRENDVAAATGYFQKVLEREPQNAFAAYELGVIAAQSGDRERAARLLDQADRNMNMWAPLEIWAYPQGRYSYARDNVRFERAKVLVELGRADEARPLLEPLVELARARNASTRISSRPAERSPLEGPVDTRFVNAPFWMAEALAASGDTRSAKKLFKEFSRMKLGERSLKSRASDRARELR